MCKNSDFMRDIAVLTYFKTNKPFTRDEHAIRDEALQHLVAIGQEIVEEELVQREYVRLLTKLAEFELKYPEVASQFAETNLD